MDTKTVTFNNVVYKAERIVAMQTQAQLITLGTAKHAVGFDEAPIIPELEHHLVIQYDGKTLVLARNEKPLEGNLQVRLATKFFLKKVAAPVFTRHHDSINDRPRENIWDNRNDFRRNDYGRPRRDYGR